MAKVVTQITAKVPRLMEAGEYRDLRFAGGKPSLQQLKKWMAALRLPACCAGTPPSLKACSAGCR